MVGSYGCGGRRFHPRGLEFHMTASIVLSVPPLERSSMDIAPTLSTKRHDSSSILCDILKHCCCRSGCQTSSVPRLSTVSASSLGTKVR